MKSLSLVACLVVAGCATMTTNTQKIETACVSATAAIETLTVANNAGKLSEDQQKQVMNAIGYVSPICSAPTVPTLDDIKEQTFLGAVSLLQSTALGVE